MEKALALAQQQVITEASCKVCAEIEKKLDDLHEKHEAYWYLRSRVAEVKDGDKNTQYFHHKASQRKKTELYQRASKCRWYLYIDPVISDDCNHTLMRPYTKDEIFAALSQMHPCKAAGPDGMHAIFYQHFWPIIGDAVSDYVCNILHGYLFPAELNYTNIALIPKVKEPKTAAEFRPIALYNVLYKLVSKVIVMRLKEFLPSIVTENQSAFVPGRLITDYALIAMELFHLMKHRNRSRKGTMALKLDMSKAYDIVEWGFLRKMLLTMGFDGRWKINYEKSEVSFSKGVDVAQKDALMGILGMRQVDKHEKYLGIPSITGRSKKILFDSLLNRIWKKLQGWKEKLLSRAGKEVLLKAVIQAIPTYLMGVYKFLVTIIQKIQAAMARFWWGSSDAKRKIHWKNWEAMCSLKCLGGMGFKDLAVFNDALLGRQAWRLINVPHSLLSRVMKAKYFPSCDFIDASLSYSGSYSWRSIWSAKALVKEGLIWRVGNGVDINIWEAPWLSDEHSKYVSSPRRNDITMVNQLIDAHNKEWRLDVIDEVFNARDKQCILAIPLSPSSPSDVLSWSLTKDGVYSVKTAYILGKGCNFDNFHNAWVEIWSLEVSPKALHFLWKLCTDILSTRALLFHRHLITMEECLWDCGERESSHHAIFHCPRSDEVWRESGCSIMRDDSGCAAMCELVAKWKTLDKKMRIKEYGKYAKHIYHRDRVVEPSARYWRPPPASSFKINVDAYLAVAGWVGLGVIARDHVDVVWFAASRRVRAFWSPEIAEAKAIEMGVRLGQRFGLENVVVESDCQTVINRLRKTSFFHSDLDNILSSIFSSSICFNSLVWSHVKRDGNFVAHHLAKLVPFGVEQIRENHFPREVAPYILMDNLSLD
ncbi:uncharacterized protein LOC125497714 [Beta vulgaris subsp. vulgaris]|uniref:uncharacterized protein LOC125497714 n=1 Tax=Beta vulgaris subsp. vulgaris TaxID=3555 RepID=UPI0020367A26|nr:uncharacterized protein LOC125497714 [Beta vulgaris subsp. vulgaris]